MTSQEMVEAVVTDAMVITANSVQKRDGTYDPPNTSVLANMVQTKLRVTLGLLLLNQSIARKIRERSTTLTVTSGTTEYTLPTTVSRVINMRRSTDNKPIKFFDSKDEHDQWYYEQYANDPVADTEVIQRAYYSGRGAGNAIKITFSPGVGAETSIPYRYVRRMTIPYQIEDFPEEIHPAIFVLLLNRMSGGQLQDDAATALIDTERFLQPVASATSEMSYSEEVQSRVNSINALYA